jgi:hypothetical protein
MFCNANQVIMAALGGSLRMGSLWSFLATPKNQKTLTWLGGGLLVVIAGLWAAYVHFFPPKTGTEGASAEINTSCGSVGIGGSVSGATISAGAANSNCPDKPK